MYFDNTFPINEENKMKTSVFASYSFLSPPRVQVRSVYIHSSNRVPFRVPTQTISFCLISGTCR